MRPILNLDKLKHGLRTSDRSQSRQRRQIKRADGRQKSSLNNLRHGMLRENMIFLNEPNFLLISTASTSNPKANKMTNDCDFAAVTALSNALASMHTFALSSLSELALIQGKSVFRTYAHSDCLIDSLSRRGVYGDAISSLVISYKLLGTRKWFVIHQSDCGMLRFTNINDVQELAID